MKDTVWTLLLSVSFDNACDCLYLWPSLCTYIFFNALQQWKEQNLPCSADYN